MTVWIGLTGGIGSGKSSAAAEFYALGVPHIDADAISRNLTAESGAALPYIEAAFGKHMFDEEGRLNRAALRDLVFKRPEAKIELEALIYPLLLNEMCAQQQAYEHEVYGILDVPLLVEKKPFLALVSRVLVIDVPEEEQIRRVQLRSGLGEGEIRRIMAAQATRKERLLYADDVLDNSGTFEQLLEKVRRLHHCYQRAGMHLKRSRKRAY